MATRFFLTLDCGTEQLLHLHSRTYSAVWLRCCRMFEAACLSFLTTCSVRTFDPRRIQACDCMLQSGGIGTQELGLLGCLLGACERW